MVLRCPRLPSSATTMLEIKQLCSDTVATNWHGEVLGSNRGLATYYPKGLFVFFVSYSSKSPEPVRLRPLSSTYLLGYNLLWGGTRWCIWLRHCATSRKVAGSIPNIVTQSFRPHCGPGVDSACNRNEYQEYFLGGKGGRCMGLTTLPP